MSERPWTAEEAAEYLGVGAETVRRWARAGKLQPLGRLPGERGEWRFSAATVRAMLGARPATEARSGVADVVAAQLHAAYARSQVNRRSG